MVTPKLNFPLLVAGQNNGEITHNTALDLLDLLVQASVINAIRTSDPATPSDGDAYIVGAAATGLWTGFAEYSIAVYYGGWINVTPLAGWRVYNVATGQWVQFNGTDWTDFPTSANYTPSNPTAITSTSFVMLGLGGTVAFTPGTSGTVRLTIDGVVSNSVALDGETYQVAYGTGVAPVNAAAATGTVIGSAQTVTGSSGFSKTVIISGLTAGTAYWFDLQVEAITGGNVTFTGINATVEQLGQ